LKPRIFAGENAVFQLRIETLRFGSFQQYIGCLKERESEGDAGAWCSQSGILNQVYVLKELGEAELRNDVADRAEAYPDWRSAVLRQEILLLSPIKTYNPSSAGFLDLREYSIVPGQLRSFLRLMLAALPVRERHGPNVGVWVPLSGEPDRVIHLWAFDDFSHRERIRAAVAEEPQWKDYLAAITPLLTTMKSTFLRPISS